MERDANADGGPGFATGGGDERFRELIEWLPAVVYESEFGPDGRWMYVSPQIEELVGYTAEEWAADPALWAKRLHPDDRDEVIELERRDAEMAPGSVTMVSEYRLLHRDGHVVWVRDEARTVDSGNGRVYWRGVLIDITEARVAQRALSEAYERYRGLVHGLPICVYRTGAAGTGQREFATPQILRLLGRPFADETPSPTLWESSLHPDDRARVLDEQERQLAKPPGASIVSEYRLVGRQGRVVWVRDRGLVADGEDGYRVIDGLLADITATRSGGAGAASQAPDIIRITCSECGAVAVAERRGPCPECGSAEAEIVSLNGLVAELDASRTQVETLLEGIHQHLESLAQRDPYPRPQSLRSDFRIVSRSTARRH